MQTENWWQSAVMYELYVDKFAGTFRELADRLDYLERLGVNCLNILPHYPSPMVDDGYDISDYRNVRADLGTMDDFKHFADSAHTRGMRVLVDLVLNHVSSEHPWFMSARASKDSPYRNYFLWSDTGTEYTGAANPFWQSKPHNWIRNEATNDYYFTTFYPEQPDLNWYEPKVLDDMCSVMEFWIKAGVDAFRIDAAPHLIKKEGTNSQSLPETHTLLQQIRTWLTTRHAQVALLAEVQGTREQTVEYFGTGSECHLLYNFPLASQMLLATITNTKDSIEATPTVPDGCSWVTFLRNHDGLALGDFSDEERVAVFRYADPSESCAFQGRAFLAMRLASIFAHEPYKVHAAHSLLFSQPGALALYYGDEIGMQNDTTIGTPSDTRRYVRGTFDWAEAERQMADPDSLFNFVASLAHARTKAQSNEAPHDEAS